MDRRISVLKENQKLLGSKISMLQETNKKKDEEAEKIRELIAECRENLNRIKCEAANPNEKSKGCRSERRSPCPDKGKRSPCLGSPSPCKAEDPCAKDRNSDQSCCGQEEDPSAKYRKVEPSKTCCGQEEDPCAKYRRSNSPKPCGTRNDDPCAKYVKSESLKPCTSRKEDICAKYLRTESPSGGRKDPCAKYRTTTATKTDDPCESIASQVSAIAEAKEKSRDCIDKLGERLEREVKMKILSANNGTCSANCYDQNVFDMSECEEEESYEERVSCRVDLNKMIVNVKGPPEDLKKLDAVQLIDLLDRFQCQELVINTGQSNESQSDISCEVPVFYITHPGNIALILGIVMVAFLINGNLCSPGRGCHVSFLLNMLYIGSFAFHYGVVLWMTFIRGVTLRFGLSREIYNKVDNLILPKYFSICVFLSAINLYSFLATHCPAPCTSWPLSVIVQVIIESATFLMELIAISYLVPAIIKLREAINEFSNEDDQCPPPECYCRNMEKLTKLSWTICLVNIFTVVFMGSNMYYISSKLHLG